MSALLPDQTNVWQEVACRQCPDCLAGRQLAWYTRMAYEISEGFQIAYFVTLTYNEWEVPKTSSGLSLNPHHITDYQKRLNWHATEAGHKAPRYYTVGEYGGETHRPHYHQILFTDISQTMDMTDLVYKAWQGRGHLSVYRARPEALMYVAGYAQKRLKNTYKFKEDAQKDDRAKEFNRMSLGIGKAYLTPSRKRYHLENSSLLIPDPYATGTFRMLPEYYRRRIWETEAQQLHISAVLSDKMADPQYQDLQARLDAARIKQEYNKFRLNFHTLPDTNRIAI